MTKEKEQLSRYKKFGNACKNLIDQISENGKHYGHFKHILGNLAMIGFSTHNRMYGLKTIQDGPEFKEKLRRGIRLVRTYMRLFEEYPEFREGEMGGGYFDAEERAPRDENGDIDLVTLCRSDLYVEYAEKMLEGEK